MYSPKIRILRTRTNTVETSQLEEYLRHVVPAEMSPDWPLDALMAQAVAARNYAWRSCKHPRHSVAGADVCDQPHCQVYVPDVFAKDTDKAIRVTDGLVCTYRGDVALTMYCASCGGHTVDNYRVGRGELIPYLAGVSCACGQPRRGHGVGMCQWGAKAMADEGASYIQILQYYYPGVFVEPMEIK